MSKLPGKMTRKQHWVPQFYLRHFSNPFGQLHAYSRRNDSFFCTSSEKLCSERDLYEVMHSDEVSDAVGKFYAQNLIEIELSELENRIAPLYDNFLKCYKEGRLEGEEYLEGKAAVCELAANLIVRHPVNMQNEGKLLYEDAEKLLGGVGLTPHEFNLLDWSGWRGDSQAVVELATKASMLFSKDYDFPVNRISKAFLEKSLSILEAHVGSGFITTSMPMFVIGSEDDSYDFDFAYVPLSSKYAAVFSNDILPNSFIRLDFPDTESTNRFLLFNCKHWEVAMSRGRGPLEHAVRDWKFVGSEIYANQKI